MRALTITLIFMSVFIPGLVLPEIYYWVDDQGTQYFSSNLESIPEAYRTNARRLPAPVSPPAPPEIKPVRSEKRPARISFSQGSPILVSAKINGVGPVTLILDTGADRTLIAASVLQKLGVSADRSHRTVIQGVTGTSDAEAVWVNSVEVGEARVGPLLVIAHEIELSGADGLLGRDFLAHFNVTIDPREQIVTLVPN